MMQVFDFILLAVALGALTWFIMKWVRYERCQRRLSRERAAEWERVRELASNPETAEEGVAAFFDVLRKGPPV